METIILTILITYPLLIGVIWYRVGRIDGRNESLKLFEEMHRQRCNMCEWEK